MMRRNPILIVGLVLLVLFGGYYAFSRYLVSKLDGTGGVTAPVLEPKWLQYSSEDGVSFLYPETYEISSRTESFNGQPHDVLVFLPRGYVPPEAGEGPPTIAVSIFENPQGAGLEAWVKNDPRSAYQLSSDGYLTTTSVGGQPALAYRYSGLYETDAVAVAAGNKIFLFSAGWLEQGDNIRADFQKLIKTVQFY